MRFAWWAIDPQTDIVGRIDDGSGGGMAEEGLLLAVAKRVAMAFTLVGIVIAGPKMVTS